MPYVASDVFVAPNAVVVGDVDMFDRVSSLMQDRHQQYLPDMPLSEEITLA